MDPTHKPAAFATHDSWHRSTLSALPPNVHRPVPLYTYEHIMPGFSARLTLSELSALERHPAHRTTYPDTHDAKLFTTHTPRYLGLSHLSGLWPASSYGSGTIIGVIDTGVWPESPSFDDRGMPPVPSRWRGECENGTRFDASMCNRKLIGARSFRKALDASGVRVGPHDYDSPRDFFGHGTHTSSTATGAAVARASHFGYAEGTAHGIAPRAHLAMYKVLWEADDYRGGAMSDVLAGMDRAVADGVDVMPLSLGFDHSPLYRDVIAVAALSAVERGVVVVCAAGNDGSRNSTYNGAPWIITVGAGTVDRSTSAVLRLGDGAVLEGLSYYPVSVYIAEKPLYYGGRASVSKARCARASLDRTDVAGKVVLCDEYIDIFEQFDELNRTGAAAGIFLSDPMFLDPEDYYIPSVVLHGVEAKRVRAYAMRTAHNATVRELAFGFTRLGARPSPQVAYFSSRGPDPVTPGVLKPDILAPGKDVVAAWAPNKPVVRVGNEELVSAYAMVSGTSMAAPHVAGVVAMLRGLHPDWGPAAIRSAIMTTAQVFDNTRSVIGDEQTRKAAMPLEFGAGHINPNRAVEPGTKFPARQSFDRTVTNIGSKNGTTYRAVVADTPSGMRLTVEPEWLTFAGADEKRSFTLTVELSNEEPLREKSIVYSYLRWVDEQNHIVSSPVVAMIQ
ncbi:Subtilisin-like protease [Acorus calamus]|uniref:Subtilisin-like protease n=1 Tax=Acorus calamus TaxID=4465 RepID=A0AAV9DH72_ACOCL|nr:Subtilisin-like protease [Acorus calamus]